jgi:hypothetical protein
VRGMAALDLIECPMIDESHTDDDDDDEDDDDDDDDDDERIA